MNSSVYDFYRNSLENTAGSCKEIVLVDKTSPFTFEELQKMTPRFPKGWFELCHLHRRDRIEFIQEFWKAMLPFIPHIDSFLTAFFSTIDDLAVFLYQVEGEEHYRAEMVYSGMRPSSFYRGSLPASSDEIHQFNCAFGNLIPTDFLAFLKIHNGFAKQADTGIFSIAALEQTTQNLRENLLGAERPVFCGKQAVDPNSLIPFYQCFARNFFQCFFADWYPGKEMGNVYFSGVDCTISDYHYLKNLPEQLAFTSFLDWLIFYLEEVDL